MRTRSSTGPRRAWRLAILPGAVIALVTQLAVAGQTATGASAASASPGVMPAHGAASELDCNGWSEAYPSVKPSLRGLCTDPIQINDGRASRFEDNNWYVGHDEPSVKFISTAPGSGHTMTYLMKVPVDPKRAPTASGSVTDYGELSIAPWFGLPMCDPRSYPQNPCKPDSDSNQSQMSNPDAAGDAFMELQLYPPGFGSFVDSFSCSKTQWCAALTIDSLECRFGITDCNPNCEEPVNFAYLQTNGVPAGPPSPQEADISTMLGNRNTLKINPGDTLAVSVSDPPQGFTAAVRDFSTGQTGYMVASAANGFMDTSITDCSGHPFTFHAEYNTASQQNQVPWAALEGGVLMEQEIGHFETCDSLANREGFAETSPDGQSYTDPDVYQTCVGGSEGPGEVGEGPCSPATALCSNSETQGPDGPQACPTDDAASGQLCEFADGYCFPAGPRPVTIDGQPAEENWAVAGCNADQYQNGDLDFDGISYQPDTWPNGSPDRPTATEYVGPFQRNGKPYPTVQFETDVGGSSYLCDTTTGAGCTAPPIGSRFYPFFSLNRVQRLGGAACTWNFGNVLPITTEDFGRDAQYGTPDVARYGGTIISAPTANPEYSGRCAARA
jgi:hypothetical protein